MGKAVISVVQSYSGNQIETEAFISDKERNYNAGLHSTNSYYLHLSFLRGRYRRRNFISKQVSSRIFPQNRDLINIRYPEGQPYKAYISGTKFSDFIGSSFIIYSCVIIVTALLIYAAILMRRKKKTGSYYKKQKKDFSNK
ncbi:hypothetical protein OSO01_35880 [Oceanobacillus sojae]|uniref:Uncharacterized protein n=1 Tax=Oceanobacillus sojae TaxID=582851 RepID=A0A511ZN80_9BACI|nr:hypothetical protein OSO01_35880 [Oceanobacillus sojae]